MAVCRNAAWPLNAFEAGTGGQLGAFLHSHGDTWSVQTGLSFDDVNADSADSDGWGLHARATYAPILVRHRFPACWPVGLSQG